jgi:hypothetical protein
LEKLKRQGIHTEYVSVIVLPTTLPECTYSFFGIADWEQMLFVKKPCFSAEPMGSVDALMEIEKGDWPEMFIPLYNLRPSSGNHSPCEKKYLTDAQEKIPCLISPSITVQGALVSKQAGKGDVSEKRRHSYAHRSTFF